MLKRSTDATMEKRMLDVKELAVYTGQGITRAGQFGKECGAARRFGRRVLYDRKVIDQALDALTNE